MATTKVIVEVGQARPWQVVRWGDKSANVDLLPALIARSQGQRFSAYQDAPAPLLTEVLQLNGAPLHVQQGSSSRHAGP